MSNPWDWLASGRGEIALAGFAGAAVSVAMEWRGWGSGARKLFVGFTTAYFTAPIGVPLVQWSLGHVLTISVEHSASAGGFLMGVGGVVIAEIILASWKIRRNELKAEKVDEPV
jgi:hypothetical protein